MATAYIERRRLYDLHRLVQEFVVDFDLKAAAARAQITEGRARALEELPEFQQMLQEVIDLMEEDLVVSKNQILMQFKREAWSQNNNAATRVAALKELARLMGMDPPEKKDVRFTGAPVFELNFSPTPDGKSR